MSLERKLKPDRDITGVLVLLSIIPVFGLVCLFFGVQAGFTTLGIWLALFALFYLVAFLRTGNWAQLAICADCAFFGILFLVFLPPFGPNQVGEVEELEFKAAYFTGLIFFAIVLIALAITRRFKWRGREIFELAGAAVDETGDGYTARPRPVGKIDCSPEQIQGFARFAARNLIALPYYTARSVTLVPVKMGEEFGRLTGLSGDYLDATWVCFDENGDVSVHIAHKDYLDYRDPLAFDPLCAALGQVFIDFFALYQKDEGVRVIDRLDALKLSIFS